MTKSNPWELIPDNVNSKRCLEEGKFDFFWGKGKNNEFLLAIEHSRLEDWPGKKLNLSEIDIEQYQTAKGYRLVLRLNDNSNWDIFLNLCQDLLSASEECENERCMLSIVHNRLQRWQKLFRKAGKKLLTADEQQGLIGELFFIRKYLFPHFSKEELFSFWHGPYGDQQDFSFGNISVEAKTKRGSSNAYIQISSAEQLECKDRECYLYVLALNSAPASVPSAFTLNDLAESIKNEIEDSSVLDLFESLLAEAGYIGMPEYSEQHYIILRENIYKIEKEFPRLLSENLPEGIHSVQYKIDLQACRPFEIESAVFSKRIAHG